MSGDVEEFLRKLIEKQMAQQPQRRPAPAPRPQAPARPMPPQPVARPVRTLQPEIVDVVELVEAEPAGAGGVANYVNQHLDTSEYQQRTGRLGAGVRAEEAALQSHFKETFGSGLKGQLTKTPTAEEVTVTGGAAPTTAAAAAQAQSGPSVASQIVAMINSPVELRRAFLLGEILRRPDFDDV